MPLQGGGGIGRRMRAAGHYVRGILGRGRGSVHVGCKSLPTLRELSAVEVYRGWLPEIAYDFGGGIVNRKTA